ncbi:MAG: PilX N-terminal domain-containing pilus assembly protein [Xylophilus ampelinus]
MPKLRSLPLHHRPAFIARTRHRHLRGAALMVVLMMLTIVMVLGLGAIQLSVMGERGSRNDRDLKIAWQGAEAGLVDAEIDIAGPGNGTRRASFTTDSRLDFRAGCGDTGNSRGLCLPVPTGKPVWLTVDLTGTGTAAATLGDFTARSFASGDAGLQPARRPRYVIEVLPDNQAFGDKSIGAPEKLIYRITAVGYGPRADIQAVSQSLFRK